MNISGNSVSGYCSETGLAGCRSYIDNHGFCCNDAGGLPSNQVILIYKFGLSKYRLR